MPDFLYKAKMANGQNTEGVIAAGSHREALSLLAKQSLFPMDVRDRTTAGTPWKLPFELPRKVKSDTVADTLTQLSDLLANGVSLLESLEVLAEQSADKQMREVFSIADANQHIDCSASVNVHLALFALVNKDIR